MKELGKDKFEEFFQDNLKDYNSSPSDDLWTELEYRIPPPPKSSFNKKIGGWLFLSVVFLLLFSVMQWWKYDNEIQNINQTLEKQEQKIGNISNDVKNNDDKISEISNELSTNKKEPIVKKNIGKFNPINPPKKNKPNNFIFEKNKNVESENVNVLLSPDSKAIETTNNFSKKIENENLKLDYSKIEAAEAIEFLNIFVDAPIQLLEFNDPYETINLTRAKLKSRSGFEIYRNYSWLFPQLELKNGQSTSLPSRNTNVGLLFGIPLNNRFILQFGIGYGKEYTGLKFQKTFEYAETEVFIDTDLMQTKYAYEFDSNYGRQLFTSYILNSKENDGQDVSTNDPFTMEIQVMRRQAFLTTPIILKYLWTNQRRRIRGSFSAGIFQKINFFEDESGEISVNHISNSRLRHDQTIVAQFGIPKTKNLDFILGAGVECKLDDRFVLIIEPNFKKSIIGFSKAPHYSLGFYTGLRWNIF